MLRGGLSFRFRSHRSLPSETNVVIGFSPDLERQVGRFPPPVAQSGRRELAQEVLPEGLDLGGTADHFRRPSLAATGRSCEPFF